MATHRTADQLVPDATEEHPGPAGSIGEVFERFGNLEVLDERCADDVIVYDIDGLPTQ